MTAHLLPPHNLDAEQSVLGAILLADTTLTALAITDGLKPEHFYREQHATIYTAMLALHAEQREIDVLTVTEQLRAAGQLEHVGGAAMVDALAGAAPAAGNVREYARIVQSNALLRRLLTTAQQIQADIHNRDAPALELMQRAERDILAIARADGPQTTTKTRELLAGEAVDRMSETEPPAWPFPWTRLNEKTRRGLRRRQIMTIGGWSSHGKSVVYDQILMHFGKQGLRVNSFINEMCDDERVDRYLARTSGVPYSQIDARTATQHSEQARRLLAAAASYAAQGVDITDCNGWSAEEVARHIRAGDYDVVGVDILHEFAHRDERDLAHIAQVLRSAAKAANAALVMTVHFNDARVTGPQKPIPTGRDIRGSGMIYRCSDLVLFVHLHEDENGIAGTEGIFKLDKMRRGQRAIWDVDFDPERMRFTTRDHRYETALA